MPLNNMNIDEIIATPNPDGTWHLQIATWATDKDGVEYRTTIEIPSADLDITVNTWSEDDDTVMTATVHDE